MPHVAQKSPFLVEVEAGKSYFWCACGLSMRQPFCDGSHKTTSEEPVRFTPQQSGRVAFCGCKHSAKTPLCDGSHSRL
jgi:CDGSH-type Zn-finger protein